MKQLEKNGIGRPSTYAPIISTITARGYVRNEKRRFHATPIGELVTDLYLAEGKRRQTVWRQIVAAMEKLDVKKDRIDHLVQQDDPALLAKMVEEMMEGQK